MKKVLIYVLLAVCAACLFVLSSCGEAESFETPLSEAYAADQVIMTETEDSTTQTAEGTEPVSETIVSDDVIVLTPTEIKDFFTVDESFSDNDWLRYTPDGEHYGFEDDYWGGCSVWCAIDDHFTKVSASSYLASSGENSYGAENITNGKRENAWVEGVDGSGVGEYVELTKSYTTGSGEPVDLRTLCIVNGYAKSEESWKNNGRVKLFRLYLGGEHIADIQLEDTIKPQYVSIEALGLKVASGEKFTLRFEIAEVYPGEKYDDTAVTGIELGFWTPNH